MHQLAQALHDAIAQVEEHNNEYQHKTPHEKITEWRGLLQKVRDLDSNLYDSLKCELARCLPGLQHNCGQGDRYNILARQAVNNIFAVDATTQEAAYQIVMDAIAEALGTIRLAENVKVIRDRLTVLRSYLNHRETIELAISRYTLEDLNWLHDVAVRSLGLFAKESFESWCGKHRKQKTACPDCLVAARTRTLKTLASAVKKVCTPETVQQLIVAAHPEEELMRLLRDSSTEPVEGVGL